MEKQWKGTFTMGLTEMGCKSLNENRATTLASTLDC